MEQMEPPWVGPQQGMTWTLICTMIVLVVASCLVPLYSCPAGNVECVPEAAASVPASVGIAVRRACACNTSTTVRVSTNARTLSNTVFSGLTTDTPDARGQSALAVIMAQFVLHDIYQPRHAGVTASSSIPQPDPVFAATPSTDLIFPVPTTWTVGACEDPVSDATPVIDLSNVYGDGNTLYIRSGTQGLLNMSGGDDNDAKLTMPPTAPDGSYSIPDGRDAGSSGLLAMHTLAMRNHNFWAREVRRMRPTWTDAQLFWKARQLNIAEWQHIVYHEWLPVLLGALAPPVDTSATVYDSGADVRVDLEVATIILPSLINTMMPDAFVRRRAPSISYTQYAGDPETADPLGVNGVLARLSQTPARLVDVHVIDMLRNIVNASNGYPVDTVANDVQLARVLRIPDWAAIYTCIGASPIAGDSRDAYQAMLEEPLYPGTSMGLTAGTVLANHFARARDTDPNFYSYTASKASIGRVFYPFVKKATMLGLLYRNTRIPYGVNDIPQNGDNVFSVQ